MFDKYKTYKPKKFLTDNEYNYFCFLKNYLSTKYSDKYVVLTQVRILDLFQKPRRVKTYKGSIDFLICDFYNEMKPVLAIELDWEDHNRLFQRYKDKQKKEIMKKSGIPLIVFMNWDETFWNQRLETKIKIELGSEIF